MSPSRLESEVEVGGFKFGYFESAQLNEPNNSVECLKRKSFRGQKLMVRPKHTIFTFRRHSLLRMASWKRSQTWFVGDQFWRYWNTIEEKIVLCNRVYLLFLFVYLYLLMWFVIFELRGYDDITFRVIS